MIFDVGGNTGQSITRLKKIFPKSFIHSFEPSPTTFEKLNAHCSTFSGVKAWNYGIGSAKAVLPFLENSYSDMSSFLAPDESCWGTIDKVTDVPVITLDSFIANEKIDFVHILKCDTQGFDFEVLKGAERLLKQNSIGIIYFEVIFSKMYKDAPTFFEILNYLLAHNFVMVGFYEQGYQHDLLSWTDVMFINVDYKKKLMNQKIAKN
jgi:FkbM family methyltransferase